MNNINNFTVIDSIYGKFIVNRHCHFQAEALIKTGKTHIESELEKIFVIIDSLPPNAIIIDGGSNIGFFSIPVSQRIQNRGGKVISFEPQRLIFYAIAGAVALNDLTNCYVNNFGLSDTDGEAMLPEVDYSKPYDFGTVSIHITDHESNPDITKETVVKTVKIDSLNLPRIDFIKLDVEGYECQALNGAIKSIEKFRPFLWVEYFLIGLDSIKQTLRTIPDYDFYIMDYQNVLCAPKEKMPQIDNDAKRRNLVSSLIERASARFAEGRSKDEVIAELEKDGAAREVAEAIATKGSNPL